MSLCVAMLGYPPGTILVEVIDSGTYGLFSEALYLSYRILFLNRYVTGCTLVVVNRHKHTHALTHTYTCL